MDTILLNKVADAYNRHSSLIVGVDFDDTIFPYNKTQENIDRCDRVVLLLQTLKKKMGTNLILCLYSVADEQALVYKEHIMECYGLKPQFVNEGPMDNKWNSKKPFFNILLDDKAGLNETIEVLTVFEKSFA